MDFSNITEFINPNNLQSMSSQLIINTLMVLVVVQSIKSFVDDIAKKFGKKVKTKHITFIICVLQVIFVMFAVNSYAFNSISLWTTVLNTGLLYLSSTVGFNGIFKPVGIKIKDNEIIEK